MLEELGKILGIVADPNSRAALITASATALFQFTAHITKPTGKLTWGYAAGYNLYPQTFTGSHGKRGLKLEDTINTYKTSHIYLQNTGRKTLQNVRVLLNSKPQNFDIHPAVNYRSKVNEDSRFQLVIDRLHANETITLNMLQKDREIPQVIRVDWPQGKALQETPSPKWRENTYLHRFQRTSMFFGSAAFLYFAGSALL
ncbi:hypothetical protein [Flexibacterium corallicola]|uniref:hypothetical protein n=1 Tax=Flexibacterium corallicola TaxID=3037259 RepID=UPI00286EDA50|nr:hypothetical protein [Pseudovibrio sp. M1P-2-3]